MRQYRMTDLIIVTKDEALEIIKESVVSRHNSDVFSIRVNNNGDYEANVTKPKLAGARVQTKIAVSMSNIETLIKEVYGHEYEINAMEEIGSGDGGVYYNFTAGGKYQDEVDQSNIDLLRAGKPSQWSLSDILQDLYNQGYLADGEYQIDVCW